MIYGPIAAGKLTVATELASLTNYKLFDNHTILNAIAVLFPFDNPNLNKIRMRLGRKYRLEMFEEAAKAQVDFITTLIIGNADSFSFIRESIELIEKHGGHVQIVQLRPSINSVLERVESESRKGLKVDTINRLKEELKLRPMQFDNFPDIEHLAIDNTTLQPKEAASRIVSYYKLTTFPQ